MGRSREKTVGREKPPFVWLLGYIHEKIVGMCVVVVVAVPKV